MHFLVYHLFHHLHYGLQFISSCLPEALFNRSNINTPPSPLPPSLFFCQGLPILL
uniref:Uncharacterized protein n=1 Tax=Arundo donax TaxID=35708 RepID=A0A0A9HFH5_ARUDO